MRRKGAGTNRHEASLACGFAARSLEWFETSSAQWLQNQSARIRLLAHAALCSHSERNVRGVDEATMLRAMRSRHGYRIAKEF
jgi:hypothetical protein